VITFQINKGRKTTKEEKRALVFPGIEY